MDELPMSEIEDLLIQEVATITGNAPGNIRADAPLHTLGLDSMGLVEVLVFIEKRFALRLMETGLSQEHLETLKALAASVARELREQACGSASPTASADAT